MSTIFYVKDYATGTTDSEAVRRCFTDAACAEHRTVIFDGRDYLIDEAILLPANTHVIIDDCTIKQADGVFDNVFRGDNLTPNEADPYARPLRTVPTQNIKIEGRGHARLIGPDKPRVGYHPVLAVEQPMTGDFWGWRTLMISLSLCDGFEISGLDLSQTMCWAISFDWCCNGYVHDLVIHSNVKNGDGIDFRSGCHHCRVQSISGYTSDDTVACTALYHGVFPYPVKNYLYPMEPAGGFADHLSHDIHHIDVKDIRTGGREHGVICLAAWGNQVHDITVDGFDEQPEGGREATVKIYTGYGNGYRAGDLHDITVKNIRARQSKYAVLLAAEVENVKTENITHDGPNGQLFG